MPKKIKQKQKQRQRQSQRQIVNVNIHQPKPQRRRRTVSTKKKQTQSEGTGSSIIMNVNPPPVPFSVAGPMERQQQPTSLFPQSNVDNIADAPDRGALIPFERPSIRTSILPLPSSIDTPINTSSNIPLDIMSDAPDRGLLLLTNEPSQFRDIYPQEEERYIQNPRQRSQSISSVLSSSTSIVPYMRSGFSPYISSGLIESSGNPRTQVATQVRAIMQRSQNIGSDVPLVLLQARQYHLPGQPRRPRPTISQRQMLYDAGTPYPGDESGIIQTRRKNTK